METLLQETIRGKKILEQNFRLITFPSLTHFFFHIENVQKTTQLAVTTQILTNKNFQKTLQTATPTLPTTKYREANFRTYLFLFVLMLRSSFSSPGQELTHLSAEKKEFLIRLEREKWE